MIAATMSRRPRHRASNSSSRHLIIALGGALGASLRWAIDLAWAPRPWPISAPLIEPILLVNVLGCIGLGAVLGLLERFDLEETYGAGLRPFLVVGVLGSFTTFSTLILQTHALTGEHGPILATAKLVGSIALGLAGFRLGEGLARARA